ncbi:MAG: hypothetical protein GTO53_04730 [Planctomycetales bacterium]|nr:hypothetical protein [Planctomycetales bacterium]
MIVKPEDRAIVEWALNRSVPFYYAREHDMPGPCLKVHRGHVTAYFLHGRLTRLWAQADHDHLDHMFAELTDLFSLCARLAPESPTGHDTVNVPGRPCWDELGC